jgi:hypothetical protein
MRWYLVATVFGIATTAAADGFITDAGELRGQVTNADGKPVSDAKVHVMSAAGVENVLVTDPEGGFGPQKLTATALVYVHGELRITGGTAVSRKRRKLEVIELSEIVPPATPVKPVSDPMIVGEYSEEALEHDTWTRAWLLLDVDESGAVARIKLLDRPGYDLDRIAIRDGFKLHFEAARDAANRKTHSLMIWSFDWPSFSWMRAHHARRRIPSAALNVPCRGTGPTWTVYRDCKEPDLANVLALPWIEASAVNP